MGKQNDVSDVKPDNSSRKDFARNGSLNKMPTPEEQHAWDNGGKQKAMADIQRAHRKTQAFVAKMNGQAMYVDKRGNN